MRTMLSAVALAAALSLALLAGCSKDDAQPETPAPAAGQSAPAPASAAHDLGSVKVGDKAICVVCCVKGTCSHPEDVKAVLDYKGKTYAFCGDEDKAEFISNTARYARAQ